MKDIQYSTNSGFGLVEMLVGAAALSVAMFAVSGFFQTTLVASRTTQTAIQGDYLLEEGMEALKLFRDTSYANSLGKMSTTTTYYFSWNGTTWATTTVNTLIDGKFERKFTISDVKRDANEDIASSGTYDPDIKLVNVSVAWKSGTGTTTRSIQTYITNIFNN
ncbi:MAG: hypothetical protein HZB11_00650 [Candidatus Yonathbacteria bacterium]|nr:hypothetical protein [Candidatus Yonathbacteria bacterium]